VNSHKRLAQEYRKDVHWLLARARRAHDAGDLEEARWNFERAKVCRVRAHHWARAARQVADSPEYQKVGEAFTQALLRTPERDFADTVVLGNRLVQELLKRGLTVVPVLRRPKEEANQQH
jgi:hypothetical protein